MLDEAFFARKPALGMVHLAPLPGSPRYGGRMESVLEAALADARALAAAGFDGLIVENMGDAPFFPDEVPPETVAALAVALAALRREVPLPLGVNVLRNDARAALGIAAATGASFIRVNVHTGAAVADQGLLFGRAHETLRRRAAIAPGVAIMADLRVKHARPLGGDAPLDLLAEETVSRGLADALIVTGPTTGRPVALDDLATARRGARGAPVLAGSGVTAASAAAIAREADGVIVGTSLKRGGRVEAPVDPALASAFIAAWRAARRSGIN
jgi:membrane complex biogenesis BtpA family protein